MDQLSDQHCISAVLGGDVDAFSQIVERYQKPIFNLMYRMTGSRADALDLAQEVFIKAYEQLHRFQRERKFFPWLYTIALNRARNLLRKRKTSAHSEFIDEWQERSGLDYPHQQEEMMCSRLDSRALHSAILQLPLDYREAIVLRYREELSLEDVADALQISLSGAKMRIHRGLKKLRDILTVEGDNAGGHSSRRGHGRNEP